MKHGTALWKATMIKEHRRDILVGRLEACAGTYAGCPSHPQASLEAATLTFATEAVQSCRAPSRGGVGFLPSFFFIKGLNLFFVGFFS